MARKTEDDSSLKRLGGGRWQTRDERFTIEPQSGTWVVIDAQQTDDLGLPLVRGPFASLNAAKTAITGAREAEPEVSPLAARVAEHVDRPVAAPTRGGRPYLVRGGAPAPPPVPARAPATGPTLKPAKPEPAKPEPAKPEPPPEPNWIRSLKPAERDRAHALILVLAEAGAPDPEATAEREVSGEVSAVARFAVERAIGALGPAATPSAVAALLAAGSADDLGVTWRLVDGEGRPIVLEPGWSSR
jgi:hypothetical protein